MPELAVFCSNGAGEVRNRATGGGNDPGRILVLHVRLLFDRISPFRSDILSYTIAIIQVFPPKHGLHMLLLRPDNGMVDGNDKYSQQDNNRV